MGNLLRDRRTPSEWADSGQVIEFSEKISDFEKLAAIVEGDLETLDADKLPSGWRDSIIAGQLYFGFVDAQAGPPTLKGRVATKVKAVCQRCLEPFELPLSVDLRLSFGDDQTAAVDDGYEMWELEEEKICPLDLVEEALIMAMPLAALHVDGETCHGPGLEADPGEKTRPFAALAAQMESEN
jgi:uncharacterized protein